jgi:hypothetical protein
MRFDPLLTKGVGIYSKTISLWTDY